jgi:plasmid stability protein
MGENTDVTTLYLRNVPTRLVREAKARAARDGATLTAFVTDAIAQSLSSEREQPAAAEDDLRDSMEWYEHNREQLSGRFRGEYVAILDDTVIDHDKDFASLATRVFGRVGIRPVFMPRVMGGAEQARVRSPRRRNA